jgi:SOS response regulatory protein OraA/RecX
LGRTLTVSELRKKLQGKNYPVDAVDAVVAEFESR